MSFHNLSHYKLLTCNQGPLIPCGIMEVLPGDKFFHKTSMLIRTSPLLAPVMHPVHASVHHWFVPLRLLWTNWESFITGGENGEDATTPPTITINTGSGLAIGSLGDYLGLPTGVDDITVSALPFRAYNLIYNEWYRDEQLQSKIAISKGDGTDSTTSTTLLYRNWEKDRFTSARPDPQLGPEVTMPLGTTAPVVSNSADVLLSGGTVANQRWRTTGSGSARTYIETAAADDTPIQFGAESGLEADLSEASAATINELRFAFAVQRFMENRSRYGGRYVEYLRGLGVNPSDARLQRPEYLGGGKQTIQFSEVLQTAPASIDEDETPVGNLAGHGIGAMGSRKYRRFFEEHGFVISLLSVKPVTMYTQGIPKLWSRETKFDYWQPELQHIGQQEVLNKEIYAAHSQPNGTHGWQDQYDEYRHQFSSIAGEFRTTQDTWHMGRIFESDTALNSAFVTANPTDRIYATGSSAHQLYVMANHSIQARRLLSSTGSSFIR